MNIYKHHAHKFLDNGYSVIPDKPNQKIPAIKEWNKYCNQMPSKEETEKWAETFSESNMSVCLGESSGIIALDLDCTDPEVIKIFEDILPPSIVEKVGTKGWTRFFRYRGQRSEAISYNGDVVIELLSTGKKTTIPPSKYKDSLYEWTGEKELWQVSPSDLPGLPLALMETIKMRLQQNLPQSVDDRVQTKGTKITSGRNNTMKDLIINLQGKGNTVDTILKELIKLDNTFETPLFTDPSHNTHTEAYTNAGKFYFSILNSMNSSNFQKRKVYEIPILATSVNEENKEALLQGKSQSKEILEVSKIELPTPTGVLAAIQNWILNNAFIKQPEFALSAALSVYSTIAGRKFVFQNLCSNLYLLNIGESGCGKDAPQKLVRRIFKDIKHDYMIGAGDFSSDAAITDSLASQPSRLNICDEVSKLFKVANKEGASYQTGMADTLAELYTSSNDHYSGRELAGGVRMGECYRPNMNMLCSTTPTGFSESVSKKSLEKGLLGRFLFFREKEGAKASELNFGDDHWAPLPQDTLDKIKYWCEFKPGAGGQLGGITQEYHRMEATPEAQERLREIHKFFDDKRRKFSKKRAEILPLLVRSFQQMLKICMISAVSRANKEIPIVNKDDVEFSFKFIQYQFNTASELISNNVHSGGHDAATKKFLSIIKKAGREGITRRQIYKKTTDVPRPQRDNIYNDLLVHGEIECMSNNKLRICNDIGNE